MNLREIKIMAKEKGSFKEFLSAVAPEYQAFVKKLDNKLMEQGCELVIKEAKSGYTASYRLEENRNELGISQVGHSGTDLWRQCGQI